jgi:hypothetical protein
MGSVWAGIGIRTAWIIPRNRFSLFSYDDPGDHSTGVIFLVDSRQLSKSWISSAELGILFCALRTGR